MQDAMILAEKVKSYSNQNCARKIHTGITSEAMQEKKKKEKKKRSYLDRPISREERAQSI